MVARKQRTRVVVDTNVLIRNHKSNNPASANKRIVRLWLANRSLQLIVGAEIVEEYLEALADVIGLKRSKLEEWRLLFEQDQRCTFVNLGRRYTESRDPDDNVFLATALGGRAEYLITNDRDLLDLPADFQRTLPFAIVTPREFLAVFESA